MRSICFLLLLLSNGLITPSHSQTLHNTDFRQKCDSTKTGLCFWDLYWGAAGSVKPSELNGKPALMIEGRSINSVGFVEQTSSISPSKALRIITIKATIMADQVEGKGAGLNIGLYDQNRSLIATKDMGGFYSVGWIRGSGGARVHKISIVCPTETVKVKAGMILYGKGKAFFASYGIETISVANRQPSRLAAEYISAACDTIVKNSLFRDSVKIATLKLNALKIAGAAKSYEECHLAISYLLESLRAYGDHHSFFMSAAEVKNWKSAGSQISKIEFPGYKIIDSVGYILVPPFHGGNHAQILAYADSLQNAIRVLQENKIKGWIVDLRKNTGGNMAPMIAGLGPLFSSQKLGSLIDVNEKRDAWYYINGRYAWDSDTGWLVSSPVALKHQLPVAVLIGNQTGSSGEAVAISFMQNAKTKLIGRPTWGLTTGNGDFELADGSKMFLASTFMCDRYNLCYRSRVEPHLFIDDPETMGQMVLNAAIQWIKGEQ